MKLIILGAGGHGKVVADIAQQINKYEEIFFLDDLSQGNNIIGKCEEYTKFKDEDVEMYPAFGNNRTRIEWEEKLETYGIKLAKIVHPLAIIEDGCIVMPYVIINTNVKIAKGCIINCGAIIDHDCVLNKGCHLAPGAIVKGENILPEYMKVDSGEVISLGMYK